MVCCAVIIAKRGERAGVGDIDRVMVLVHIAAAAAAAVVVVVVEVMQGLGVFNALAEPSIERVERKLRVALRILQDVNKVRVVEEMPCRCSQYSKLLLRAFCHLTGHVDSVDRKVQIDGTHSCIDENLV